MKITDDTVIVIQFSEPSFKDTKKTYKELKDDVFSSRPRVLDAIKILLEEFGSFTFNDRITEYKSCGCTFKIQKSKIKAS